MDYDHRVAAEQNVDEQQYQHQIKDDYDEDNQREDYYSERGGGGVPMDNVDDSTTVGGGGGHDLKQSIDDSSAGKLFVGGIAWETTKESFSRYFGKYGEITDSVIMMDKISGRPRGFGFVTFADPEIASKVLEEEHVIDGRTVEVKRTVPREDTQGQVRGVLKTKKIFVGGLPLSLTEDELREYFSAYGNVMEHQIMLDHKTGRTRGFGFVTFESEDAVEKIFSDGQMHELNGKQVEIKRAEPKRAGNDHASDSRMRRGGSNSRSYGGYSGGADGFGGGYVGKMGRGYGGGYDGGYGGGYGGYGNYGGNYGGGAGFYPGYGGYGYGYGFGGPMYGGAAGYGASSYGTPGGYGGGAGYGGGRGYGGEYDAAKSYGGAGGGAGYGGGRGYGGEYDAAKSYGGAGGGAAGYGGGGSGGDRGYGARSAGGYGGKGYGNGSAATGRFHPYGK